MNRLVPLTKIILTLGVSVAAIVLTTPQALAALVLGEMLVLFVTGVLCRQARAVAGLAVFAALLGVVQYLGGGSIESSYVTALRMMAMTVVFLMMLVTTRLQDLTASLVTQLRIPYTYAFMFTAALRFVPDFLAENRAVFEAQECRGLVLKGHFFRRLKMYPAVVQPLVLRSLARSETMALSLELRGFGGGRERFSASVTPQAADLIVMGLTVVLALVAVYARTVCAM